MPRLHFLLQFFFKVGFFLCFCYFKDVCVYYIYCTLKLLFRGTYIYIYILWREEQTTDTVGVASGLVKVRGDDDDDDDDDDDEGVEAATRRYWVFIQFESENSLTQNILYDNNLV